MENDHTTINELLKNESFLAWYYKTDPDQVAYWENELKENLKIMVAVEKAVAFLNAIQIQEPAIPPNKIIAAEQRLLLRIGLPLQTGKKPLDSIDTQVEFDNAPMREVKIKLEAVYGIKIVFADETIASETITCMMPSDNLNVFIESLQATMVYQVYRMDNILTIARFSASRVHKSR